MFLSDRDLEHARNLGDLIIRDLPPDAEPCPIEFDPSGVDLHLDSIEEAKTWAPSEFEAAQRSSGTKRPSVGLGSFDYKTFSQDYAVPVPVFDGKGNEPPVYRDGNRIIVCPWGFLLWLTREEVGTPEENARYICFVNGKSTRSRLGLIVHLTAPTIDAGWYGKVTLEIANLGPFRLALEEGDAIAQLTVAMISSPPLKQKIVRGIDTAQSSVTGTRGGGKKGTAGTSKGPPRS